MIRNRVISLLAVVFVMIFLPFGSGLTGEELRESARTTEGLAKELADGNLAGGQIVVRIYSEWQTDPRAYELVKVLLTGFSVSFDAVRKASGGIDDSAIIVLTGPDQRDELAAAVVGDSIYAERYEEGKQLFLWPSEVNMENSTRWIFNDALGAPIPEASVDIFVRGVSSEDPRICLHTISTDKQGQLEIPRLVGALRFFTFVVSDPNYGVSVVDNYLHNQTSIVVPLVPKGTIAYERAIRGIVLDPDGHPVDGAEIRCTNIRTLGEGLINSINGWTYTSLTDERGAFSFYLPNENRRNERGYLIPPKSKYQVRIEARAEFGLLPYVKPIENGYDTVIVLERGARFRTFVFEDANGPITDQNKLKSINIMVKRKNEDQHSLRYDDWKDGGVFPLGIYYATTWEHGKEYEFEPLTVNEYSPEELIFKLPEEILYYGQIIHGLTGEPMPGAFVIGCNSKRQGNLSMMTDRQWEALRALPADPCLTDPAVKPICEIYGIKKIVRTDEHGYFQMSFRPGEIYGFIAFEENYLGLQRRRHALIPDENRTAEVPAMKLYPAATVLVEACTKAEHISIWPRWIIDENDNAVWVRDFLATDDRRESMFTYDSWIQQNEVQSFHIPAGLNVRIKLDTPYDEQWCPIEVPKVLHLAQGEVVDLGWHEFKPALEVLVQVTDAWGEPAEGVPVRRIHGGNHWGVAHNSDASGIARFHVVPNSQGEFGVSYHGEDGIYLRETIPYTIGGNEDSGRQFTLQLSSDMLDHLFK